MSKTNNVSDEAVKKATGKTWAQWLNALDSAGCRSLNHKQIVAIVTKNFDVGPWWQQMVTVGYERSRGMRRVNQKPDGYEFSVSKTIAASAADISRAWIDPKQLKRWMGAQKFEITSSKLARSVRIRWPDSSRVSVMFYPKGAAKAQVSVQHGKLPSAAAVKKMRSFWTGKIARLQAILDQ